MSVRIIGGTAKGRKLPSTRGPSLRPTSQRVRGAIFSILGQEAIEGAKVLDLYAGTGAFGMEALSRGAAWVDFVEGSARQCAQIQAGLKMMGFDEKAHVYHTRVEKALNILSGSYALILMDPPYATATLSRVIQRLAQGCLLRQSAVVVVEHSSHGAMEKSYGRLKLVKSRRYGDTGVSIYTLGEDSG